VTLDRTKANFTSEFRLDESFFMDFRPECRIRNGQFEAGNLLLLD